MHFENLLQDLPETPRFTLANIPDYNPVSGQFKRRLIGMPNDAMRLVHRRLIMYLRGCHFYLRHATCHKKGDSAVQNVYPHRRNRYFYLLDLRNAYGSVDIKRLAQLLFNRDMKFWNYRVENVLEFLNQYCCYPAAEKEDQRDLSKFQGVVVGAPASPVLFNIFAGILIDDSLGSLCKKLNITYTRYIDDLTFSSRKPIGLRIRRQLREIIVKAGFAIHDRKARVVDLRKRGSVVITGVALGLDGRVFLPRSYVRKLRGLIHKALTDPRITVSVVEGHMGVFWALHPRRPNKTEQKLIDLYEQWRKEQKG